MEVTVAVTADMVGAEVMVAVTADMVGAEAMAERVGAEGTTTITGITIRAGGTVMATISTAVIGHT